MQTILSFTLVAAAALVSVEAATSSQGCFSSSTGLTANGTLTFNSVGSCNTVCTGMGDAVFAMQSSMCYCGNELPPASMKADDSGCVASCPGYPSDKCGGSGLWSVYLTGLVAEALLSNAPAAASDISSGGAKPTTKAPSASANPTVNVVTSAGQTVYVTATGAASSSTSTASKSSGPSTTGIAVGVVIGIVVIAAACLGLFFFIRNKRRREVEEEYRRNAAVSSFISSGKPPGSSGANSFADTRLEPAIMANRRMSDGSIADNQDYSRRILKVTNA